MNSEAYRIASGIIKMPVGVSDFQWAYRIASGIVYCQWDYQDANGIVATLSVCLSVCLDVPRCRSGASLAFGAKFFAVGVSDCQWACSYAVD